MFFDSFSLYFSLYGCVILCLIAANCLMLLFLYRTYIPFNDVILYLIQFLPPSDSKAHTKYGRDVSLDELKVM